MALISCRECNKKVSSDAQACPHCGAPKKKSIQEMALELYLSKPKCPFCGSSSTQASTAADKLLAGIVLAGNKKCLSCQRTFS